MDAFLPDRRDFLRALTAVGVAGFRPPSPREGPTYDPSAKFDIDLWMGPTPGEFFDHSQFGVDAGPVSAAQQNGVPVPNPPAGAPTGATGYRDDLVDTQLRVLQAYGENGRPLGTLINFAAHADVMGSGNLLYSADWPGTVARATEVALGEPVAVTMVADVGRTQPPRPNSDPNCDTPGHPDCNADKLATWTRLFTPWVLHAVSSAVPVRGTTVASDEVFTRKSP